MIFTTSKISPKHLLITLNTNSIFPWSGTIFLGLIVSFYLNILIPELRLNLEKNDSKFPLTLK